MENRPPSVAAEDASGFNLLEARAIRRLFEWRAFPYVFQFLALSALLWLAAIGWGVAAPGSVPDKLFAKTNLVNLAVWGLFWPSIVWVTALFGRVWCLVCPLDLVSNACERGGRALGIPQPPLGRWVRAGWVILIAYALLQLLVPGIHLHRVPAYTSVFLAGLALLAAGTGLLYRDRAFCRGFCPIGLLLRVYGRGGMLAVRPVSRSNCAGCAGRACRAAAGTHKPDGRSCPSLLNPATLNESTDCLICGQCFKSCTHANMGLFLRLPFHAGDTRDPLPGWPVVLFVMLVSGFVASEVASEWTLAKAAFATPVDALTRAFDAPRLAGWIEGVWTIVLFPGILWLGFGAGVVLCRGAGTIPEAWRRMALPVAVVIAAGQMAKGLAKFVSRIGFLPVALKEPDGFRASVAMAAKRMPQPPPILPMPAVSVIGLLLLAAALWLSVREARLTEPSGSLARTWPQFALAAAFGFTVYGWGFLQ